MNNPRRICVGSLCRLVNSLVRGGLGLYFFLIPAVLVLRDLPDRGWREDALPQAAWRLHRNLTPAYARWAEARVASGRATELSTDDVAGTEWPLFGSVFYLWATESLQAEWERGARQTPAPREYARPAVDAALDLVIDPNHAAWVKQHWGDVYLLTENVFYRMLLIAALTSHANLTGDTSHLAQLRELSDNLAEDLARSPHGLLNDYPGECYPGDVLTAIACIRRAGQTLGRDYSAFVAQAERGFQGAALDQRGLVPYAACPWKGQADGPSRGCGNSYVCLFAPELWPASAAQWYAQYERYFWQTRWTAAGFREFPRDLAEGEWYMDVDSGPVLAGYGLAACAFGVGAARVNGRFDHAWPLAAELLATSWPLADGTLAWPRLLSSAADAPYLGEAAILYVITRRPAPGLSGRGGGSIPLLVYLLLGVYIGLGLLLVISAGRQLRRLGRGDYSPSRGARAQAGFWLALLLAALGLAASGRLVAALLPILLMQLLPRESRRQPDSEAESTP